MWMLGRSHNLQSYLTTAVLVYRVVSNRTSVLLLRDLILPRDLVIQKKFVRVSINARKEYRAIGL